MDYKDVHTVLLDLPYAFKRTGYVYTALIASITASLSRNTRAIDMLAPTNVNLSTAKWGWLDAIGRLFGIIRNQLEIDNAYRARIMATLSMPKGTPLVIAEFVSLITGSTCTVTEDFSAVSYQLNFSPPIDNEQLQQVVYSINWVRPAGVPFLPIFQVNGGLYLHTCGYFGNKAVTGSYLTKSIISISINIGTNTNNPVPTLPIVYLVDPFIGGLIQPNIGL